MEGAFLLAVVFAQTAAANPQGSRIFEAAPPARTSDADIDLAYSAARRDVSPLFFGMTVNRLEKYPAWPGLGTRAVRLWDTHTRWMDIEPQPGQWDFSRTDLYVDFARRNGAEVVITLGQPPAWAAAVPHVRCHYEVGCSPPASIDDWRSYVRALATRYGSAVKYYELWNEPDEPLFYRGSASQLAALADAAREEIRQANPDSRLIGPSVTWKGLNFLDRFLNSPGGSSVDILSFHNYVGPSLVDFQRITDSVLAVARRHGMHNRPVWNTEFGVWCGDHGLPCAREASGKAQLQPAKAAILLAASGIQNADWYFWERTQPNTAISLSLGPAFDRPSPAGSTYGSVAGLLQGSTIIESWARWGLYVVRLERGSKSIVIMWSEQGDGYVRLPPDWPYRTFKHLPGSRVLKAQDGLVSIRADALLIGES